MPDEAHLNRSVTLHCMGDPGQANFQRILGWIGEGLGRRSGPFTRVAIWNGLGFVDNVREVGRGQKDLAIATPAAFIPMALDGRGPYADEAFPNLRAIATMPQNDRLVLVVDASLGVRSFAEIRDRKVPLRIATAVNDGINHIGLAAHALLAAAGIPDATLTEWGGGFALGDWYPQALASFRSGAANAIMQEAIMTQPWQAIAAERDLVFVPFEDEVLEMVEQGWGWRRGSLPAGYFRGLDEPLQTLDFSDFLIFVRDDMPEDLAYVLARLMVETRGDIEARYRHLPPERSPLSYPIEPAHMADTPIPLHPGAARYYASQGLI
jgi:TRAP transporter TAXI family solute receptor